MNSTELTPKSPMSAIMEVLPGARRALFSRYHLGGCQSCGFSPEETLEQLAERSGGLDAKEMLDHMLAADELDQAMLMTPEEVRDLLATGKEVLLIDTRTREEHEAVMIPGSRLMTQELQQQCFAGDPHQWIVLYDHQGKHVLDHCSWFQGHGLPNARGMAGGIDAWSQSVDSSLRRYRLEIEA